VNIDPAMLSMSELKLRSASPSFPSSLTLFHCPSISLLQSPMMYCAMSGGLPFGSVSRSFTVTSVQVESPA